MLLCLPNPTLGHARRPALRPRIIQGLQPREARKMLSDINTLVSLRVAKWRRHPEKGPRGTLKRDPLAR